MKKLKDLDLAGRRALVRVDYNVPLKAGAVADNARIRETLPTLRYLLDADCRVALISHLGRPAGKPEAKYSLRPAAVELETLVGRKVLFVPDCVGPETKKALAALGKGEIALLENLRFHPEEEKNDDGFARRLAEHGDAFVQDAFGALHRAHASTAGIPKYIPAGVGLLVEKELNFLSRLTKNPERPFAAILGGAKVSDKLGVLLRLVETIDVLIIGGGMAYTFLAAQGVSIGKSLLEKDSIPEAKKVLDLAARRGVKCLLPVDHVAVPEIKADAKTLVTPSAAVPDGLIGVDIGPRSAAAFAGAVAGAKTVFWNGPMGIFEMEPFFAGSLAVAQAMADATAKGAVTIVGGGDSLAVLAKAGLAGKMSHCSTGGGASLEFIEGRELPGLAALDAKPESGIIRA